MIDDSELLRRYAEEKSEAAFADFVQRRIAMVYGVALRKVGGDAQLAEDVAQQVFTALAAKAPSLWCHPALTGWLFTSTHYAATQMVRAERRRHAREQKAQTMNEFLSESGPVVDWERLRPVLDDLIRELGERDREAVLLRFFEGRSLTDVGTKMRLTEEGARSRVGRAVGKMQAMLARRGVNSTGAALALALANQSGFAAPAGLAASVASAALVGAGTSVVAVGAGIMNMTTLQIGLIGAIVVAGVAGWMAQAKTDQSLLTEFALLERANKEVVSLRTENRNLARVAADVAMLRVDPVELARAREEVRMLQQRLQSAARTQTDQKTAALPGEDSAIIVKRVSLPDADPETGLHALELYTGRKIVRDSSLGRLAGVINVVTDRPLTTGEVIRLLRTQLRDHCGIVLEVAPDGTIVAKRVLGR